MKKLLFLLTILVFFSCGEEETKKQIESKPKLASIDDFGKQIFNLIQSDNYNAILDYMPDLIEYKSLINQSSLSDYKKEKTIKGLEQKLKSNIETLKKTYSRVKKNTDKSGIDWSKSKLDYIDYKHEKENKIETADIYLKFSFKGVNYKIELKECLKIGGTWFIGNQINWKSSNDDYYNY